MNASNLHVQSQMYYAFAGHIVYNFLDVACMGSPYQDLNSKYNCIQIYYIERETRHISHTFMFHLYIYLRSRIFTGSGAHPASSPAGTQESFPRD
jgi:hypothetical protein